MNEEPQLVFNVEMSADDVRLLRRAVDLYLERWAGGDANEQTHLLAVQSWLRRMVLEAALDL